jgi:hypothetical protein
MVFCRAQVVEGSTALERSPQPAVQSKHTVGSAGLGETLSFCFKAPKRKTQRAAAARPLV